MSFCALHRLLDGWRDTHRGHIALAVFWPLLSAWRPPKILFGSHARSSTTLSACILRYVVFTPSVGEMHSKYIKINPISRFLACGARNNDAETNEKTCKLISPPETHKRQHEHMPREWSPHTQNIFAQSQQPHVWSSSSHTHVMMRIRRWWWKQKTDEIMLGNGFHRIIHPCADTTV